MTAPNRYLQVIYFASYAEGELGRLALEIEQTLRTVSGEFGSPSGIRTAYTSSECI